MVGTQIGRYRVLKLLGAGGMGSVYLAEHEELRRRVALKVLHANLAAQPALVARFLNEARAATAIQNPAFVAVYDWDRTPEGAPYFIMELLDGQGLDQRIDAGQLPLDEALRITEETAAALTLAHARGIIHRDLKPANLFLAADPGAPDGVRLKVLDFGVAKLSAELSVEGSNTRTGQMLGTPTYMAPEQCLGSREIDHRADIYALGAVLFEMVCGKPPFVSQGFGELINMHINEPPPRASARRADVPAELDRVIVRALAKNPDERQQTMTELAAEVADVRRRLGKRAAPTGAGDSAFTEDATKRTEPSPVSGRDRSARVIRAEPSTVGTVPPVAVPTTVSVERPGARGKGWLVALGGAALAVAAFATLRGREAATTEPARAATPDVRPASVPAPVTAIVAAPDVHPAFTATPDAAAAPRAAAGDAGAVPTVTEFARLLETAPPGAAVRTVAGDEDLGVTPLRLARPAGTELPVRIVLPGHRPALRTLRFDDDGTEEVRLERASPARARDNAGPYRPPSRL